MDLQLMGRRALVTGARRGIGRAIAQTLAEEGCALALCARGPEALEKLSAQLREQGAEVYAEPVDVTAQAALAAFVEHAAAELGGLDVVVSNVSAGASEDADQWQKSLDGDLVPFVRLTEAAVPTSIAPEAVPSSRSARPTPSTRSARHRPTRTPL